MGSLPRSFWTLLWSLFCFALFHPVEGMSAEWSSPHTLSAEGGDASAHQIALNENGEVVVVWVRSGIIQAATFAFGSTWSVPVDLSAPENFSSEPYVAINDSGQTVAIWKRQTASGEDIQTSTLDFGGEWTPAISITPLGNRVASPRIAINAQGDCVALWTREQDAFLRVETASRPHEQSWSNVHVLSTDAADALSPCLAYNDAGQRAAVWICRDVVQAATATGDAAWSLPVPLSKHASVSSPLLVMDSLGTLHVSWKRAHKEGVCYEMGLFTFGGEWTTPVFLTHTERPLDTIRIAFNKAGRACIAWEHKVGPLSTIFSLIYDYSKWSAVAILSEWGKDASHPYAVLNNRGNIVCLWLLTSGSSTLLQAATTTL